MFEVQLSHNGSGGGGGDSSTKTSTTAGLGLVLEVDGVVTMRLNGCCVRRYGEGSKVDGPSGRLRLLEVVGGADPCYRCVVESGVGADPCYRCLEGGGGAYPCYRCVVGGEALTPATAVWWGRGS